MMAEYNVIKNLPKQLAELADSSSTTIHEIDLDGDGKNEYIVCYTVDYEKDTIGDGEPEAFSQIQLYDSNFKKIANLVTLEEGFWAGIKAEDGKIFLSLDEAEYIDIDEDGIMEIFLEIPTYEVNDISILKYDGKNIEGEVDYKASLLP